MDEFLPGSQYLKAELDEYRRKITKIIMRENSEKCSCCTNSESNLLANKIKIYKIKANCIFQINWIKYG